MESRRHARSKTGQARISPQRVEVTEEFAYTRSANGWQTDPAFRVGKGTVSVVTSIDDNESLATPGRLDLRALQIIGHDGSGTSGSFLAFHNHGMSDLERVIRPTTRFDAIRLRSPEGAGRPPGRPAAEGLDRSRQLASYEVGQPTRQPIEVALALAEGEPPTDDLGHDVYLLVDIELRLPNTGGLPEPRLESVEFDCPWLTGPTESLGVRRVQRSDHRSPRGLHRIRDASIVLSTGYDTIGQAIVCRPDSRQDGCFLYRDGAGGNELTYSYSLLIEPMYPLQLILGRTLTCRVAVTFDALLSGTEVDLHNATGFRDDTTPITSTTLLKATAGLDLDRAMSQRVFEHRSTLRFPRIQPSPRVLDCIRSTVVSTGFRPEVDKLRAGDEDGSSFGGGMKATRLVAGRPIEMAVFVSGRSRRVERTLRGTGLPRLKEQLEAGDVEIELYGNVDGDPGLLTSEMNTLHAALRGRLATFAGA